MSTLARGAPVQRISIVGRGGEIRTRDPHNPIVVRYQAALRPDWIENRRLRQTAGREVYPFGSPAASADACPGSRCPLPDRTASTFEDLQHFLKLHPELADHLRREAQIGLGLLAFQTLTRTADREALLVQQ